MPSGLTSSTWYLTQPMTEIHCLRTGRLLSRPANASLLTCPSVGSRAHRSLASCFGPAGNLPRRPENSPDRGFPRLAPVPSLTHASDSPPCSQLFARIPRAPTRETFRMSRGGPAQVCCSFLLEGEADPPPPRHLMGAGRLWREQPQPFAGCKRSHHCPACGITRSDRLLPEAGAFTARHCRLFHGPSSARGRHADNPRPKEIPWLHLYPLPPDRSAGGAFSR